VKQDAVIVYPHFIEPVQQPIALRHLERFPRNERVNRLFGACLQRFAVEFVTGVCTENLSSGVVVVKSCAVERHGS
jgi:hypothetical protein